MKTLETLVKGETLLTQVRKVSGGKFQIEIAEFVENPNAQVNIAALLNKGDERFDKNNSKPRRAWQSATEKGCSLIGISVKDLKFETVEGKEIANVNMLNPSIQGMRLHIKLVDSFTSTFEGQTPKQTVTKDGVSYFMKDGKNIYQSTEIVAGTPVHSVINSDARVLAGTVNVNAVLNEKVISLNA